MINLKALEAKIDKALSELTPSSVAKWYDKAVADYYGSIELINDEEFISYNTNKNESSRDKHSRQTKEAGCC